MSIQALGGTPPYQYAISYAQFPPQIQTSNLFASLCEGAYNVWVIDSNGCMTTQQKTITTHTVAPIAVTYIVPTCLNSCDGQASVTSIPGAVYTIAPSGAINVATGFSTGLCAGVTYTITATDGNGCTSSTSVQISNAAPINFVSATATPSCLNGSNGSISVVAMGGVGVVTFSISPFTQINTTGQFFNRSAQTYSITVTDAIGCSSSTIVTVPQVQNTPISISNITQASCIYECDGSALFSGIPGLVYTIAGPGSPNISSNGQAGSLCATGVYVVSAIDGYGCWSTASLTVGATTIVPSPTISYIQHSTCAPGNDGFIVIPDLLNNPFFYTYDIQPTLPSMTMSNDTIKGMPAGVYIITASDPISGCMGSTYVTINYGQYQPINVNTTTPSSCSSCTGSVTLSTGSITSLFINPPANIVSNSVIDNLCANTMYTVMVTDAYNCSTSTTFYMTSQNINLTATSITNSSCYPGVDGAITVTSNGQTPITYTLQGGQIQQSNTTGIFTGLSSAIYTIHAIDANNCTSSVILFVQSNPNPIVNQSVTTATSCQQVCNGAITLSISNQTPSMKIYRYETATSTSKLDSALVTNPIFQNLCSGQNYFEVADSNCTWGRGAFYIPYNPPIIPEATLIYPCKNQSNGSIRVTNILPNTTYSLNPMPAGAQQISTGQFINLSNANYILTTFNTLTNCSVSKDFNLTESSMFISNMSYYCNPNALCNSLIILKPERVNLPLTYTFSPNTSITKLNDSIYTGFCKDSTYQILYTDSLGCSYSKSKIINNYPFNSLVNKINPSCTSCNGSITTSTDSPFPPFTFQLSDSFSTWTNQTGNFNGLCKGNYTMNITDSMGFCSIRTFSLNPITIQKQIFIDSCFESCKAKAIFNPIGTVGAYTMSISPSIGSLSGNTFSNLCAGTYTLHVSDMSPCTLDTVFTVYQNTKVQLSTNTITPSVCGLANGKIIFICSGGRSDYNYITQPGNLAGQSITNLVAQTYTCVVSDDYNCKDSLEVEIIDVKPVVIDSVATVPSSCYKKDGLIWIYPRQNFPYSFKGYSIDNINWQGDHYFEYVDHGIYTIYAKIHDGCIDSTTATVGFKNNLQLENLQFETEKCTGTNDGAILLPENDLIYSIEPHFNVDHENRIIPNLPLGTYTLTASDTRGCTGSKIIEISAASPLTLQTNIIHNTYGDCHGEVQVTAQGGTPPYNFLAEPSNFVNISDSGTLHYLCNTQYEVMVRDKHGCEQRQQIFIPYQDLDGDDFAIYPNPAQNEFNFIFSRNVDVVLTLSDISGRVLYDQVYIEKNKVSLPVSHLSNGVYFVTLNFDGQKFVRKLEVRH
jgi:hypothetical protein